MSKKNEHRSQIYALIAKIKSLGFDLGGHDCAMGWTAPVIQIQTGIDLGAPYRGKYTTFAEAVALLKADGFSSPEDVIAAKFKAIPAAQAQFGDIVAVPGEHDGWSLGVVLGERIGALLQTGYCTAPRSTASRAYRIE